MPRLFKRIVSFEVEGEIYDNSTTPESILRNYEWHFKNFSDNHTGHSSFLEMVHKDCRGQITDIHKLPKIQKPRKPDTEFFVI